jgi:pSer/pThr/pTyr-binding forkhead associated (FHA) protein
VSRKLQEGIMSTIVRLTVLSGPHLGNRICLAGAESATFGRAPQCDVCFCGEIRDPCMSRRHCRMTFSPPELLVEDLASANGTYINGERCHLAGNLQPPSVALGKTLPSIAKTGDVITLGGTSFHVEIVECPQWQDGQTLKQDCTEVCADVVVAQ